MAVLGVLGTLGLAALVSAGQRGVADQQLDRRVSLVTEAASAQIRRYVDTLHTVAGATGSFEELTAAKFAGTTRGLVDMHLPGASNIAFMVSATDDDVGRVQAFWRGRGVPDLVLTPKGRGPEHIFSIFNQSLDGTPAPAAGLDVTQLPQPFQALEQARRGGGVSVSETYLLIRDQALPARLRQLSFVLAAPVYGPPDASGFSALRGWLLLGLRGQTFVAGALNQAAQGLLDITLLAGAGAGVQVATLRAAYGDHRNLYRETVLPVADRQWRLRIGAAAGRLPGVDDNLPRVVLTAGAVVSLLLAGLVFVLVNGRDRARSQVVVATREANAAEARARDQARLLTEVLDALSVSVVTCDIDGRIVHSNRVARGRLGEDITGAATAELAAGVPLEHPDGTRFTPEEAPLLRSLRGEIVDGDEARLHVGGGDYRASLLHSRPLRAADGSITGAVASSYDITALRQREAELAAFAGLVAHDLKSPITAIAGYAEVIHDELLDDPTAAGHIDILERIMRTGERMRRLIDDLLSYAATRDGAVEASDVDVGALVNDVLGERLAAFMAHLRPEVYVADLHPVRADPAMVRQVVDNLVGNAFKYTQPDKVAHVDITSRREPGGWVRIEVADRGIGIPAGQHDAVFNDFHRAHATGGYAGTGLGLAICRRIVQRHGGSIGVADNPGGGSRFWFTLPAPPQAPAEPGARPEASAPTASAETGQRRQA
jgi:signal transduction histidine kinase